AHCRTRHHHGPTRTFKWSASVVAELDYFFFLLTPRSPKSTLFPYTTLFRSKSGKAQHEHTFSGLPPKADGCALNGARAEHHALADRKSTRLNSSHVAISYAVFCLKKKT